MTIQKCLNGIVFKKKMIDQNQSMNGFWGKEKMKKMLHKLKEF
jgi:hypothetical protein